MIFSMKAVTSRYTSKDAAYNECFKFFATRSESNVYIFETKSELVISNVIVCWLILFCDAFKSIRDSGQTFKSIEIRIALNDW